jgi:hypothetical protein
VWRSASLVRAVSRGSGVKAGRRSKEEEEEEEEEVG